ncbi:neuropilin and tolloid-like protein 2 [Ctenocephalides felis]|uniref:neuropilin and tolloid-like protein 2 n=1 Tax=Ctenocephalides felis TaxID=7515 RepID=UPI000E6E36B6|nr:neuropilin and tolloid-like protein 2 [Ctenocephalides felis]
MKPNGRSAAVLDLSCICFLKIVLITGIHSIITTDDYNQHNKSYADTYPTLYTNRSIYSNITKVAESGNESASSIVTSNFSDLMTEHNIVDFRIMINKSIKLNLHDRAISGYELFDISKKLSENMNIVNNSVLTDLAVNNIKQQSLSLGIKQSHVKRNLLLHDEDPCLTFTVGDPDAKILYSPGYPGHYPKKANCVVILEAPPGHLLRLDFRDYFDIEPSEGCKFDFLEIRDGMYGFSMQIGQYCGQEFPPMVTSRDRHLWLHFQSDENIEYSGFKMVYEYILRPTTSMQPEMETCVQYRSGDEGYLNRSDIPEDKVSMSIQHNMPLECLWIIKVPENWKIQLQFLKFELVRPNDCDVNFVDIYPERTDIPHQLAKYCGSRADSVTSDKNVLNVRFVAEAAAAKSNFIALFTAFRDKPAQASCEADEYDCEDATCISSKLRCNGKINCRFRWDEDECPKSDDESGMSSRHIIIIMVIFSLILCGMCSVFLFKCIRKLIQDHKTIKENIRESREFKLDELENKSAKLSENISRKHSAKSSFTPDPHTVTMDGAILAGYVPTETFVPIPVNPYPQIAKNRFEAGTDDHDVDDMELPDTCDIACQTRESLFRPLQHIVSDNADNELLASVCKDKHKEQREVLNRYTAEAVIEMTKMSVGTSAINNGLQQHSHRPDTHLREATRSAPDVIIMASCNNMALPH